MLRTEQNAKVEHWSSKEVVYSSIKEADCILKLSAKATSVMVGERTGGERKKGFWVREGKEYLLLPKTSLIKTGTKQLLKKRLWVWRGRSVYFFAKPLTSPALITTGIKQLLKKGL